MSTDQAAGTTPRLARPAVVPGWIGGAVGVVAIVVVWWVASRTLFTASGAIPARGFSGLPGETSHHTSSSPSAFFAASEIRR